MGFFRTIGGFAHQRASSVQPKALCNLGLLINGLLMIPTKRLFAQQRAFQSNAGVPVE